MARPFLCPALCSYGPSSCDAKASPPVYSQQPEGRFSLRGTPLSRPSPSPRPASKETATAASKLFSMASESKPPLLAAPLEIRHIIYRYVWTIPIDADKHLERYFPSCLNENYFKLQFGQIHALVSICQQMRDEVLAEYFPRTQVYLRSHHRHVFDRHRLLSGYYESHRGHFWDQESHRRGFDLRSQVRNGRPHFDAIHYIIRPPLFTQNTQHVSLLWKRCFCPKDMTPEDIETSGYHAPLDWLLKLGQLKTLELVIADPDIRTFEALRMLGYGTWTSLARILPCRNCFSKLLRLRNLEKVVFKPLFDDPTVGHIQGPEVNRPNWVARIKKEVSDTILRKDPNQGEQQPLYVIEQHIGAINIEWPRSFRI